MTDIQKKLLKILEWFHIFCVENNIRYYLIGGSMIGAARHQGFIPWDDDIDIGMPREDYEKFINITYNKKYNNYIVESIYNNKKDYVYPFAKIYDISTTLIENTRYKTKRGIYIDVFPLDGIGSIKNSLHVQTIFFLKKLMLGKVCGINKNKSLFRNLFIYFMRIVPECILNHNNIIKYMENMCKKNHYEDSKYVGNLYGAYWSKEFIEKEIIGNPTLYKFENIKVYGVENYNEFLSSIYGDWRKVPPIEKQKTHHDFLFCDLEKSYIE